MPLKTGDRNRASGVMGWRSRASASRNAAKAPPPPTSPMMMARSSQPRSGAEIRLHVRAPRPVMARRAPSQSRPRASLSRLSGIARKATAIVKTASGKLIQKIKRQPAWSDSQPPTSGPIIPKRAPAPAQVPKALPRSSGGKVEPIRARAPGVSSAAPIPCKARPPISISTVGARPQAMDARAKMLTPIRKTRRRPNRSPAAPPMSTRAPSISR
ncbi:hypothetical protein D3C73_1031820 [compost metagenome]